MFKITGNNALNGWCIYTLHNAKNELCFIWAAKIATVLGLREVLTNPAFDSEEVHTLSIVQIYNSYKDAQTALLNYMQVNRMPAYNKTIRYNRYSRVKCNETGQVFRNQLEAAQIMGINQSQLSKHLRRAPGYKSIKNLTFSNIRADIDAPQPVQYPPLPV